jgi:ATP-dependent helicase HrpA
MSGSDEQAAEPEVKKAEGAPPVRPLTLAYPKELPISARVPDIRAALREHQVLIVAGATGSGKTTQLPKVALERQVEPGRAGKTPLIGVTQPRRIAATSVAARVAEELECDLGKEVGYQIRFENRTTAQTRLKFMTDGILLAEIQGDPLLRRYHTLIIDEAHERGLTIDFLLGWLKQILPRRPDLKVIVSSATIETARFSDFFGAAPVIAVEGRTFPVDVLYEPPDPEMELADAAAQAVENLAALDPNGDFLVFLPGEREILDTEKALNHKQLRFTEVLPLYARLSAAEQNKVFAPHTKRRVILSTNVAETSLTIPGIVYVVDTGVARLSRYDSRTGITRLHVEPISRASADQRKGRAGRVRDGVCVRLYGEDNFEHRQAFTDPEIRRVGLDGVILRMKSTALGDVESFPFIDTPSQAAVTEGYRVLTELGALDKARDLTPLGAKLARLPVDSRVGRMILAGAEYGVLREVIILAAALEVQDPRERPRGMEAKADQLHRRFRDESSDFDGLLKLWAFIEDAAKTGGSQLRRVCKENFLSFRRVREWREVQRQLESTVRDLKLRADAAPSIGLDKGARVHCALLSGLLSRIGQYNPEQRVYMGARQTRFVLHPSSGLAKKPPAWIMAFELVETSQLFARAAAKIEPEWLSLVADHLLKRSYSDPHWSEKTARAVVRENSTLFGLQVLRERSVDYSTLSPGRARLMFLDHALVRGEYASAGEFQRVNRDLMEELAKLRNKARRSDMLSDDDALLTFFDRRVPSSVVNGKTFEQWRTTAEKNTPRLLHLSLRDVLAQDAPIDPADYPDEILVGGICLPLCYVFDPSRDDDGATLTVPLALLSQLDPGLLDWTIPAWHETKVHELLLRLPKAIQRSISVTSELATTIAQRLVPFGAPFVPALERVVREVTGVTLPPGSVRPDLLPGYLRFTVRIIGKGDKVLAEGRDVAQLFAQFGAKARAAVTELQPTSTWKRNTVRAWDFGDLPTSVTEMVMGSAVQVFPALRDGGDCVELCVLPTLAEAEQVSRAGVRRLMVLAHERLAVTLAKNLTRELDPLSIEVSPLGPSKAQKDAFAVNVLERAIAEASAPHEQLPRSAAEFAELARRYGPHLEKGMQQVLVVVKAVNLELRETRAALATAAKQPSGAAAVRDMQNQVAALLPPDLLQQTSLAQVAHLPRYLRGIRIRLARAVTDPRKDAAKLEPFAAVWQLFQARKEALPPNECLRLRWAFEELRIALFAPELKPAYPVSVDKLKQALQT